VADIAGFATLVAVTVTACREHMEGGAVYVPVLSIPPTIGLRDQVSDWSAPGGKKICGTNCCDCEA